MPACARHPVVLLGAPRRHRLYKLVGPYFGAGIGFFVAGAVVGGITKHRRDAEFGVLVGTLCLMAGVGAALHVGSWAGAGVFVAGVVVLAAVAVVAYRVVRGRRESRLRPAIAAALPGRLVELGEQDRERLAAAMGAAPASPTGVTAEGDPAPTFVSSRLMGWRQAWVVGLPAGTAPGLPRIQLARATGREAVGGRKSFRLTDAVSVVDGPPEIARTLVTPEVEALLGPRGDRGRHRRRAVRVRPVRRGSDRRDGGRTGQGRFKACPPGPGGRAGAPPRGDMTRRRDAET